MYFLPDFVKATQSHHSWTKKSTNPVSNNNETKGTEREVPTTRPEYTGSTINNTGQKIYFSQGLDERYCSMCIASDMTCQYGNNYKFKHALFPSGFTDKGVVIMMDFVEKTDGLSWNPKCKLNNVSTKKPRV